MFLSYALSFRAGCGVFDEPQDVGVVFEEDLGVAVGHAGEDGSAVLFFLSWFIDESEEVQVVGAFVAAADFLLDMVDGPGFVFVDDFVRFLAGMDLEGLLQVLALASMMSGVSVSSS